MIKFPREKFFFSLTPYDMKKLDGKLVVFPPTFDSLSISRCFVLKAQGVEGAESIIKSNEIREI